jgi:glycine betaine/proline transport system substrate-binding protein
MVALGAILILSSFTGCFAEKEAIIFAELGWDTAGTHAHVASFIVEHGYGYPTELIPTDTVPGMVGIQQGSLDVYMELGVESVREAYDKLIASGQVVDLGINLFDMKQGWLVPTYMIEEGDLPEGVSVFDLPDYWELFKDPEDPTKGRYYGCLPGWMCYETDIMQFEAWGLNDYYNIFIPGSDAALAGSIVAAFAKHEPWLGFYWSPTWVLADYDMTWIEMPPFDQEVWDETRGCEYAITGNYVIVNVGLLDSAPDVVEFLRNYETNDDLMNEWMEYIKRTGADTEDTAIWFLQEYESVWTEWVDADIASKVKAALP